jgi:hypothetical protein
MGGYTDKHIQTPAMAAGLTGQMWTIKELMTVMVIPMVIDTK